MLTQKQIKHVPAGTAPAYCGPGDRVAFLITGAETSGAFFMAEVSVEPGGGPPPHVHSREEESFYVYQGMLAFQIGGKELNASAGDFIHLPRGTVHSFKNPGQETAKLLIVATPAGLEGFFAEAFYPAADAVGSPGIGEAAIPRIMAAASKYGLQLCLPGNAIGSELRS